MRAAEGTQPSYRHLLQGLFWRFRWSIRSRGFFKPVNSCHDSMTGDSWMKPVRLAIPPPAKGFYRQDWSLRKHP